MIDAVHEPLAAALAEQSAEDAYHPGPLKNRAMRGYLVAGTVVGAAKAAGINRKTWYNWFDSDPVCAATVALFKEVVIEDLEGEAFRRAKDGSDTLRIFLLKANRPGKY